MPKKITITEERWCCQPQDLELYHGLIDADGQLLTKSDARFCKYCGTIHIRHKFMDPAGSNDYEFLPIRITTWNYYSTEDKVTKLGEERRLNAPKTQ